MKFEWHPFKVLILKSTAKIVFNFICSNKMMVVVVVGGSGVVVVKFYKW